jgi:serine/threonine-protein kinase
LTEAVSSSGSGSAGSVSPAAALVEADDAFVAEERALDVLRLRVVLRVALGLTLGIAIFPIAIAATGGEGLAARTLGLGIAAASLAWATWRAERPKLDDAALARVNVAAFVVPAIVVAVAGASADGIVSPIAHADLVLLTAHALALPRPWRRAAPTLVAIALSWPLVVLAMTRIDAGLASQLEVPRLRADFQETSIAIAVGAALAGVGQDIQWQVRRAWLSLRRARAYRIESVLGEGGMGVVYRAIHPTLGRPVALKKLSPSAEPEHALRFVREVRATAALVHPNIVRILDCGVTGEGEPFYTMELLEGGTLAGLVGAVGPLPFARAAYLVHGAARALGEAHARGLVHRDVKPENLFVATEGGEHDVMKVLDFGIAKSLVGDGGMTADGALIGTPRYMAPEQAVGETIDPRTDVYALGGALYFALTGSPPVDEPTVFAVLAAHAAGTIVPLRARRPDVPDALAAVVSACLSTDRAKRFESGAALADALEATGLVAAHRPSESAANDAPHASRIRSGTRTRSRLHASSAATRAAHG